MRKLKMKKIYWVLIVIAVLAVVVFLVRSPEDSWIEDEKGEYVEHGESSGIPDYVREQQMAIMQARELYFAKKAQGMRFSSQCLGVVGGSVKYAVDIVHIPRTSEDNLPQNQCQDYREGKVQNFIELDRAGNIVRIV